MKKHILHLVIFLNLASLAYAQNPQWLNFTNGDGITAFAEEGEYIWVGTAGGLVKLQKTTGDAIFYNKLNSGLPINYVYSIAKDGSGTKWIGTWGGGLAAFDCLVLK
jgi:ligand-binding sensor domain-containing protein